MMKLWAIAAYLMGLAGASIFYAYVLGAGLGVWPRHAAASNELAWLVNSSWLFLFAIQHTGMARHAFKRWMPAVLERSVYVACSGIILAAMTLCWQPLPGEPLWHGPLWIAAISLLAIAGIGLCCRRFDHLTFFGLSRADPNNPATLDMSGPYRFVRHPLMLGLLVAIWAQPIMPPELLMMNIGLTIYVLIAIRFEEHDLLREYGDAYEEYRAAVPALFPWRWR